MADNAITVNARSMSDGGVTAVDLAAARRIVGEFRSEGWPAKEEELARSLVRFRAPHHQIGATPRERIARTVAWEHFGIAWENMERQSHADVLAMVDRMLDGGKP